jgi:methyl-accepting chemotaxis protein WspA
MPTHPKLNLQRMASPTRLTANPILPNQWTIRRSIFSSFAVILAVMLVMSGIVYFSLRRIQAETRDVAADSLPSLSYSFEIMTAWLTDYALTQRSLTQTDKADRDQLSTKLQASQVALDELIGKYAGLVNSTTEQSRFNTIKAARTPYLLAQNSILALMVNGRAVEVGAAVREQLDPALENAKAAVRGLVDFNEQDAREATKEIFDAVNVAELSILGSFGGGLILAVLCGNLLMRSIRGPLGQLSAELGVSGVQVRTSMNEIAATAKEHQATASEIAATTAEISATSKEISATSRELVKTMNEVAFVAEQSATLAGSGQTGLAHMEETMRRIMEAAGLISAQLAVLNEKADNIGQVVTTITKVADQTNLLSLNAAIEAEKAGEHGRGFGVVAVEIRRLADQTAMATTEIGHTVREIQAAISASVMGMDRFGEEVRGGTREVQQAGDQLSQIIQHVQALAPRADLVNEGMQAQSTGAEQITMALGQLSEAAQQTVEALRQSSMSIDALNQVVTGLSGGVARLELMI